MTGSITIRGTTKALERGETTSLQLVEDCLVRIRDPNGQGSRAYIRIFEDQAREAGRNWDKMRNARTFVPHLAGIPISVKDLCDVATSTTTAGSIALKDRSPAKVDAPVVSRLRAAGAVINGTTNMTEFAMGALGLNPHYGTPRNPFDSAVGRIPGGSSSGAAISVTDGMAVAGIGSDTAGSIRIPAALCGIVGFKPTARRVPLVGTIPLAPSLDSIGPLAASVTCCALLDAAIANELCGALSPAPAASLRLAVPTSLVLDEMTSTVAKDFERSLTRLSEAGIRIVEIPFRELREFSTLNAHGGFSVVEGYAWHRSLLAEKQTHYDPIVARRFLGGANVIAADYIEMLEARHELIKCCSPITREFDAILMPTVPITAPPIADFLNNETLWLATNRLLIRNPGIANILDRCAISLPCHEEGSPPVGLTLMGETMNDRRLLSIALAVELLLSA